MEGPITWSWRKLADAEPLTLFAYPGYGDRIQAQAYLERFYGPHGFEPEGEAYLEDGIPHIDMTLTPGRGPLGA